jgi:hypothetical protein
MRTRFPAPQADYAFTVQPSDSVNVDQDSNNDLDTPTIAIYYAGAAAADIAVIMASEPASDAVTFANVQPGSTLPIAVRRVMATNTTAAAGTIIGLAGKQGFI